MEITQSNVTDFTISHGSVAHTFNYSEVSTSIPSGHTTLAQFIQIILSWTASESVVAAKDETKDSFARVRISNPIGIFDEQFHYGLNSDKFNIVSAAGGTVIHMQSTGGVELKTTGAENSTAMIQTKQYMPYQQCKSMFIEISAVARTAPSLHNTTRIGYFDDTIDKSPQADQARGGSGVFFQVNGSNAIVIRTWDGSTQIDNVVNQSDWSLDTMDGSGPSCKILDTTKINNFIFDLSSDGGARVRCGVKINGEYIWCHEFSNSNASATPNIANLSLPIRIESKSNGTPATTQVFGIGVVLEGANEEIGRVFGVSRGAGQSVLTLNNSADSKVAVALRLQSTKCRGLIQPQRFQLHNVINNSFVHWRVILNPESLTGGAWNIPTAASIAETNTSVTSYVQGTGTVVASGYCDAQADISLSQFFRDIPICSNISGTVVDTLVVVVDFIRTNAAIYCSIEWKEIV